MGQLREQVQDFVGHAIRPCADRQSDDAGIRNRLLVHLTQPIDGRIGVRRRLKVRHEVLTIVASPHAADALVDLFRIDAAAAGGWG